MEHIMDHFGKVVELAEDDKALVRVRKNSICGNCGRCGGLFGDPEKRQEMLVEVNNPIGAKAGQMVRLEARAGEMLLAAFLLYFVPLVGLLLGIIAGRSWALNSLPSVNPDLFGLGLGLVLMVLVFLFLRLSEKRFTRGKRFKAVITAVVSEDEIPEYVLPE
ncbi:MAG: SoxR reducing system RseC family protein [Firmicutes bacterium]|nr:SoxR reducing system RseC family protein [Bacillota bacterium]